MSIDPQVSADNLKRNAREIAKSTLCILCMVRDSAGFTGNALKDIDWAIQAQRDLLEMTK